MSFAFNAAPFDDDRNTENHIHKKKSSNNKTQKKFSKLENFEAYAPSNNITSGTSLVPPSPPNNDMQHHMQSGQTGQSTEPSAVINSIHNLPPSEEDYANYTPFLPQSKNSGYSKEAQYPYGDSMPQQPPSFTPPFVPLYQQPAQLYMPPTASFNSIGNQQPMTNHDIYVQKLNYIINLLEQCQDEKTNHITEEIILYIFLGIFIIFLIDSFIRVGKYIR